METKHSSYQTKYIPIYLTSENVATSPVTPDKIHLASSNLYEDQNSLNHNNSYSEGLYLKTYASLTNYVKHNKLGLKLKGNKVYKKFSIDQFLKMRNMSLKKFMNQLKMNNVKYLQPGMRNYLDENIILTPMPYKNKQLLKSRKECNEYLNAERGAVSLRIFEYTHGLRSKESNEKLKEHCEYIISEAAQTIQSWWKLTIKSGKSNSIDNEDIRKALDFNNVYIDNVNNTREKQIIPFVIKIDNVFKQRDLIYQKESFDKLKYVTASKAYEIKKLSKANKSNNSKKKKNDSSHCNRNNITNDTNKIKNNSNSNNSNIKSNSNNNTYRSQVMKAKKLMKMPYHMFIIESTNSFSLFKSHHILFSTIFQDKMKSNSINTIKKRKIPKKIKPIVEIISHYNHINHKDEWKGMRINQEILFSYDIKPYSTSNTLQNNHTNLNQDSINKLKLNKKKANNKTNRNQNQQNRKKGKNMKYIMTKIISHSYIPKNSFDTTHNSQSGSKNCNFDYKINHVTLLQEQKPFSIHNNVTRNQNQKKKQESNRHALPVENVIEKSYLCYLVFSDQINVSQSISDIKPSSKTSRSNSNITKNKYGLNKILLLQRHIRLFLSKRKKPNQFISIRKRALLLKSILKRNNTILKKFHSHLLLSAFNRWKLKTRNNLKTKAKAVKDNNTKIINNAIRQSLLKIINRINQKKTIKNKYNHYFNKWKQISKSPNDTNKRQHLKIKSFGYSIHASQSNLIRCNNNESDVRSLKILMLIQKIKKCILRRKYSFLKLLFSKGSKKLSMKSLRDFINDSLNYSINHYCFNILSMANIHKGLNKLNTFIQLQNDKDFFYRLVLLNVFNNGVNVNNKPILSFLKYGNNTTNNYNKTLSEILKQNVNCHPYVSSNRSFYFVDYVKKLVSENEENKSTAIKRIRSARKKQEIENEIDIGIESNDELDIAISKIKNNQNRLNKPSVISSPPDSNYNVNHNSNINIANYNKDSIFKSQKGVNALNFLPIGVKTAYSFFHNNNNKNNKNTVTLRELKDQKEIL